MPDFYFNNIPGTGPIIRSDQGAGAGAARDFIQLKKNGTEVWSVSSTGLPDPGGNQATRFITIQVGDIAADSDTLQNFLIEARATITVTAAYVCVDTATADGSVNGQIVTLKRSNGDATVATYTTAVANPGLAQATWTTMGAITNGEILAGGYLYCTYTKVAGGLALSGLSILVNYTMST